MKDTILNSFVILAAVSAFAYHLVGDLAPAVQEAVQQASAKKTQVAKMEKTVVTAHRMAQDMKLASVAGR